MSCIHLILLTVGTSTDVFFVCLGLAACGRCNVNVALAFGLAAALAACVGQYLPTLVPVDSLSMLRWMQSAIIAIVGLRAIRESVDQSAVANDYSQLGTSLVLLAVTSSLDCLVVGGCSPSEHGVELPIVLGLGGLSAGLLGFAIQRKAATAMDYPLGWLGGLCLVCFAAIQAF